MLVESEVDQNRVLVEAEAQKRQNLEETLAEARSCLGDHSSFLRSSPKMIRYDVSRAFHYYLRRMFDAVHEPTAAFCSVSSSQVETNGK